MAGMKEKISSEPHQYYYIKNRALHSKENVPTIPRVVPADPDFVLATPASSRPSVTRADLASRSSFQESVLMYKTRRKIDKR